MNALRLCTLAVLCLLLAAPAADARTSKRNDPDRDGLTSKQERRLTKTNPRRADSDRDRIPDGLEDPDRDGLSNRAEIKLGTNPRRADTNGNGIKDGREDRDRDRLSAQFELILHTSLSSSDSDHDGTGDAAEDPGGNGVVNGCETGGLADDNPLCQSVGQGDGEGGDCAPAEDDWGVCAPPEDDWGGCSFDEDNQLVCPDPPDSGGSDPEDPDSGCKQDQPSGWWSCPDDSLPAGMGQVILGDLLAIDLVSGRVVVDAGSGALWEGYLAADAEGSVLSDADGYLLDENGDVVLDENGEPLLNPDFDFWAPKPVAELGLRAGDVVTLVGYEDTHVVSEIDAFRFDG